MFFKGLASVICTVSICSPRSYGTGIFHTNFIDAEAVLSGSLLLNLMVSDGPCSAEFKMFLGEHIWFLEVVDSMF